MVEIIFEKVGAFWRHIPPSPRKVRRTQKILSGGAEKEVGVTVFLWGN